MDIEEEEEEDKAHTIIARSGASDVIGLQVSFGFERVARCLIDQDAVPPVANHWDATAGPRTVR